MKDVVCPYCGYQQDVDHEDFSRREDELFQHECYSCDKMFVYSLDVQISFKARRADCLNGGEHLWEKTQTFPVEFSVMRCNYCGKEKPLAKPSE